MRISAVHGVPRYPVPPAAVVAAAIAALLALFVVATLPATQEGSPVFCPFRAVTGLPCPFCGFLRAARLIAEGRIGNAFAMNPLDAALLLVGLPLIAALWLANLTGGVALRLALSPKERRAAWGLAVIVLAANWAFVLYRSSP